MVRRKWKNSQQKTRGVPNGTTVEKKGAEKQAVIDGDAMERLRDPFGVGRNFGSWSGGVASGYSRVAPSGQARPQVKSSCLEKTG